MLVHLFQSYSHKTRSAVGDRDERSTEYGVQMGILLKDMLRIPNLGRAIWVMY